jgi:hypothetical protein
MPSPEASIAPCPAAMHTPPAQAQASPAVQLAQANGALWAATLALMTAFMHAAGPAHRHLLARRISRNFDTLSGQDCFDSGCRASFARLAKRWHLRAEQFAPEPPRQTGLRALFS